MNTNSLETISPPRNVVTRHILGVGGVTNLGEYSPTTARALGDGVFFGTTGNYAWMSIQKNNYQFQIIALQYEYKLYYRTVSSSWAGPWHKLTGTQAGNDEISSSI